MSEAQPLAYTPDGRPVLFVWLDEWPKPWPHVWFGDRADAIGDCRIVFKRRLTRESDSGETLRSLRKKYPAPATLTTIRAATPPDRDAVFFIWVDGCDGLESKLSFGDRSVALGRCRVLFKRHLTAAEDVEESLESLRIKYPAPPRGAPARTRLDRLGSAAA